MIYELRFSGGKSSAPTFCEEACAFLTSLHPSFQVFDPNPLSDLADELSVDGGLSQLIQVVYEDPNLPLVISLSLGQATATVKMGVFGEAAQQRVSQTLQYAFAFADHFGLTVTDPQLGREIKAAELTALLPQIVTKFDQMLDF